MNKSYVNSYDDSDESEDEEFNKKAEFIHLREFFTQIIENRHLNNTRMIGITSPSLPLETGLLYNAIIEGLKPGSLEDLQYLMKLIFGPNSRS